MKNLIISLSLILASATSTFAEFKLSNDVYTVSDLAYAKAEAKKRGKPISILYSNRDSTCPLSKRVSEAFMDQFDRRTIMIYAENATEDGLPAAARKNLNSEKCGQYIPWLVLMDAEMEKTLITTGYSSYKEDDSDTIRAVKKAIRDYKK